MMFNLSLRESKTYKFKIVCLRQNDGPHRIKIIIYPLHYCNNLNMSIVIIKYMQC